ncbi:MAG: FtsK/SpoIIIE domain-containing protein [Kineosporiaceae bacterium]
MTLGGSRYDTGRPGQEQGRAAAATLRAISGPDQGREFPLHHGTNLVGRDYGCDVRLSDPLVSKRHARIHVTDVVEIVDENSANGVVIGGGVVSRFVLAPDTRVTLGDTTLAVTRVDGAVAGSGPVVAFNRSPRLDPRFEGVEEKAPAPPEPPRPVRIPRIALIAPVLMGGVLYLVTHHIATLAFVALSPLMMVGNALEGRMAGSRGHQRGIEAFRAALEDLVRRATELAARERELRCAELPSVAEVADAVAARSTLLWTRRPADESFLRLRLGLGSAASRSRIELPSRGTQDAALWAEAEAVAARFAQVDAVPIDVDLRAGGLGVSGPLAARREAMAAVMLQIAGLHSPHEVLIAAVCAPGDAAAWDWLKWLPHAGGESGLLPGGHLACSPGAGNALVSALEELLARRLETREAVLPVVVLLVEERAPVDRGRLVGLAERGREAGIVVIWTATDLTQLPAACRTYLHLDPNLDASLPGADPVGLNRTAVVGYVDGALEVCPVQPELLDPAVAAALARTLAPVVDAGVADDQESELPSRVSFLELAGRDLADSPDAVVDRWRLNHSLPDQAGQRRRGRDNTLRAPVGEAGGAPFHLDLREQGPHALVGGTTGAGKSELLQAWVLGMATAHSPARVTFLFVDYKGGAAFSKCVELPHCVGLVTDLSPRLVQRVLTSLKAELRHREHLLHRKKAKDLLALERSGDPEAPPSLVIVVDEFAALAKEVPEFVDGVVDVAQRGRSLGLHLILATQRPAGVIRDNLRANTNLRLALRMADEADSSDVVGTAAAAAFDPGLPGRAVAKTGHGRLTPFQAAYAGGWTSETPPPPRVVVESFGFGGIQVWEADDEGPTDAEQTTSGPNDLERIVATVQKAAASVGLGPVRRPWLDELAPVYHLQRLPSPSTDAELVFGVGDDPDGQRQPTVSFLPDRDGAMAVYGTGGSGKSTALRSLAVAAADTSAGGPCQVYGLDFGARGLEMLTALPHVGSIVNGDDHERLARLLRMLRDLVDARAARYARVAAGSITEYRAITGDRSEPRILLLLDGLAAFRQAYEVGPHSRLFEIFLGLALDGRPVGVHVVVTADRAGAVPSSLASSLQRRLVLRVTNETDLVSLGAPMDGFGAATPPGRGFLDGMEVQVAVYGGTTNVAEQAGLLTRLGERLRADGVPQAPAIGRLADRVAAAELGSPPDGSPLLGMGEETLAAIGFAPGDPMLLAGAPQSGKTTALLTLVGSLSRWRPDTVRYYLGNRRSPLPRSLEWARAATTPEEVAALAGELSAAIKGQALPPHTLVVVVEGLPDFLNTPADLPLQDLVKTCRSSEQTVIAEGETSALAGSWPLLMSVRSGRHGLVLQPDQGDGDMLFRTTFPRGSRADFPPGRGLYVRSGRVTKVQVALPD